MKFTLADEGGELVFPTQAWAKEVDAKLETLTSQMQAFSRLIDGKGFIKEIEEVAATTDKPKGQQITYITVSVSAGGTTNSTEHSFIVYDGAKGADGTSPAAPVIGVVKEGENYFGR